MIAIIPVLLVLAAPAAEQGHTYVLSIGNFPLKDTQHVEAFSFDTWGVEFETVCHIPDGWRIKAGSSATPNGELSGEGSQGATWFSQSSPKALHNLVLVRLYDHIQRDEIRSSDGSAITPATFTGHATISTDDGDLKIPLDYKNIVLKPASRCPAP